MKKILVCAVIIIFAVGCAVKPTENKIEKILDYESDSLFVANALPIIDEIDSPELKFRITDRLFPLVWGTDNETYQKVLDATRQTHNDLQFSLLANNIVWKNRDNKVLEDRLFSLIQEASKKCRTDDFIDALSIQLKKRGYSPADIIEAEPQYRSMILDTYAYYLVKKDMVEEALKIYNEILEEYEDPEILINLSKAQASLNRYQQALESVVQALKHAPNHEEALSLAYEYGDNLVYPTAAVDSMVEEAVVRARNRVIENLPKVQINIPLPDFTIEKLDGSKFSSDELKGKTVVMDFFATWCGPCRRALPKMHQMYHAYKEDENVVFMFISTDKDRSKVKPFVENNQYTFPVYYSSGLSETLGVKGVPTFFVIDPSGNIRYEKIGYSEGEDMEYMLMVYINSVAGSR